MLVFLLLTKSCILTMSIVGYVQALQMVGSELDQVMLVFLLPDPQYG
jgi:hypothetical protein